MLNVGIFIFIVFAILEPVGVNDRRVTYTKWTVWTVQSRARYDTSGNRFFVPYQTPLAF